MNETKKRQWKSEVYNKKGKNKTRKEIILMIDNHQQQELMAGAVCEDKSGGFCYSGGGFDPDMFNLTAGMEMIGFSKNNSNHNHEYKPDFNNNISEASTWQENNEASSSSTCMRCVFPCEGNERPSQGLSLSLSSANPSTIGLQSFELRNTTQECLETHHFLLKNSNYLVPAQELLNEFCSLAPASTNKPRNMTNLDHHHAASSSKKHSPTSIELVELHKTKTKLLAMLEEVERRYRNYRSQMKAVAASFEAVAGNGAGRVYTAMALKAMSRHCKRLKDGIMDQIEVTRRGMGEKDPVAPGTTRGQTPRLKIIDQAIRQQRAFQQMTMMESHPWRPQRGLPERSVSVLRAWLFEHFLHPYPSDVDKHILARQTGLSRSQVSNWFINARVRLWKPMVEEMYLEEVKEQEKKEVGNWSEEESNPNGNNLETVRWEDEKGGPERHVSNKNENEASKRQHEHEHEHEMNPQEHSLGLGDTFGSVELEFSSYAHHQQGGGVSLTLGLQQHGVSLAFPGSAVTSQHHSGNSTLFYPMREHHINQDSTSAVHYSLLDADPHNLPYRNLMAAQLLHDFAG